MIPFKSHLLLTVPPTLEKRLEALAALRTLQAQDEEFVRQRRAAIAALRRDVEELQRIYPAFLRWFEAERAQVQRLLKYNPDEPRVPAGQASGGQWTSEGGIGAPSDSIVAPDNRAASKPDNEPPLAMPINDSRVISDATPDNTWKPGAQYAGGVEDDDNESRAAGRRFEGTPAQEARDDVALAQYRSILAQVRRLDPTWSPSSSLTALDSIEGDIARLKAATKEAEAYLARLRDLAKPRDRNTQEPISPSMDKTGDPFVDSTTEKLNAILDRVVARIGPRPDLSPTQYGTMVHEEFKKEVRAAGLPGVDAGDVEKTFGLNKGDTYGAKDSVRPDVVLRDDDGNIVAIYDVKTGAGSRTFQIIKYRLRTGSNSFVPLFELHPRGRTIWRSE